MKINWNWDTDSVWDHFTLLGSIKLTDETGHQIIDKCTLIDSWVPALLDGLNKLEHNNESNIDLIVEPDPLEFLLRDNAKIIKYGSSEIVVSDCKEAINQLVKVCVSVLSDIEEHNGVKDNEAIKVIGAVAGYS